MQRHSLARWAFLGIRTRLLLWRARWPRLNQFVVALGLIAVWIVGVGPTLLATTHGFTTPTIAAICAKDVRSREAISDGFRAGR
jgi:hypothetical protein